VNYEEEIRNPKSEIRNPKSGFLSDFGFRISWFFLCFLCGLLFFHQLADRDLWSSHEARAAQNAQGIVESGDWLPRLYDQRPELQKPPLYYWLVAGIAHLRSNQVDAWAVRLPAALSALGSVLLLYIFGRKIRRPLAGLIAAVILATSIHFTWLARVGRIDMPLTLASSTVLLAYYLGLLSLKAQPRRLAWPWFFMAYLSGAVAVLLKGPIGIVLPAAVIGIHLLAEGELSASGSGEPRLWRRILRLARRLGVWWGIPLFLLLTVPCYCWLNDRTSGQFFRMFFWYHNVERGFGGSGKLATHSWWFYGPAFARGFLPWTPALLLGVWSYCSRSSCRHDAAARFGLVWLVGMVGLLSLMRFKRVDYLLPACPGAAIFLGAIMERWLMERTAARKEPARRPFASPVFLPILAMTVVVVGCVVGWLVYLNCYLPDQEGQRGYTTFAMEIRRRVPAPRPIIFFRIKAHLLTFHLGKPVDTLLEWENLDWWVRRPDTYVIMPPAIARESRRHLKSGTLVEVLRTSDSGNRHLERPLVLLRTKPYVAPPTR
jgi:4-amino-4-deoxy-L-arabinose transferase-like glycosyltransferase